MTKYEGISGKSFQMSVLCVGFCLSACVNHPQNPPSLGVPESSGQVASNPSPSASPLSRDAQALGLELLSGQKTAGDQDLPTKLDPIDTASSTGNSMASVHESPFLMEGDQASLKERLSLPENGQTDDFLVWPEAFAGTLILGSTYQYQVVDEAHGAIGVSDPQVASQDSATGRWFISLSDIFGKNIGAINPLDQQVITLDLHLADSTRVSIRVTFVLDGPFPGNVFENEIDPGLGTVAWPDMDPFLNTIAKKGYPYATDQVTNPTSRLLVLWARVAESSLIEKIEFQHNHHSKGNGFIPTLMDSPDYYAQWNLGGVGILVNRRAADGAQSSDLLRAETGSWISIQLLPGESASLAWAAFPSGGQSQCSYPAADIVNIGGQNYTDGWQSYGAHLNGTIERDLWLTADNSEPQAGEAESSVSIYRLIDHRATPIARFDGIDLSGASEYSACQGFFVN